MDKFARAILGDRTAIPLHEASAFFMEMRRPVHTGQGVVKTAGWQDLPDVTGALEGQFDIPIPHVVGLMGKCAMNLLRLMTAGLIYAKSARGQFASEVKEAIRSNEWDHKNAFEYLIERMSVLAGAPHIPDPEMPPPSTDPVTVAQLMIRAEQEAIQSYQELSAVLGRNPMKARIAIHMQDCQSHLDKLWMALPSEFGEKPMEAGFAGVALAQQDALEMPVEESPETQLEGQDPEMIAQAGVGLKKVAAALAKWAAKEVPLDADLKETGRQRAVTTIAAEHHRESARRGERVGRTVGMLGGATAGGAIGHALGKGSAAATLGGAALGGLAGRSVGTELGTEADIRRHKTAAVLARWVKLADDAGGLEQAAPMASPTDSPELAPVNYLQAEAIGQQLQTRAEVDYYKRQAQAAAQQAAQAQQEAQMMVDQVQQESAQAKADASMAAQKVMAALGEATRAKDEALKQTETAARMRIGQQDLRMRLMELAAQDPNMAAAMSLAETTGQGMPLEQPGGEVVAPEEAAAAMAPPEGEGEPVPPEADPSMAQPKTGSAKRKTAGLSGAGVGALLGGVGEAVSTRRGVKEGVEPLQGHIAALQAQDGSFQQAAALAKAKSSLANRELAVAYPRETMLRSAGKGAVQGALLGNTIENQGRQLHSLLSR